MVFRGGETQKPAKDGLSLRARALLPASFVARRSRTFQVRRTPRASDPAKNSPGQIDGRFRKEFSSSAEDTILSDQYDKKRNGGDLGEDGKNHQTGERMVIEPTHERTPD